MQVPANSGSAFWSHIDWAALHADGTAPFAPARTASGGGPNLVCFVDRPSPTATTEGVGKLLEENPTRAAAEGGLGAVGWRAWE